MNITDNEQKQPWLEPALTKINLVEATLGAGGTSCDGNNSLTQTGSGNDDDPDSHLCTNQ